MIGAVTAVDGGAIVLGVVAAVALIAEVRRRAVLGAERPGVFSRDLIGELRSAHRRISGWTITGSGPSIDVEELLEAAAWRLEYVERELAVSREPAA